MRTGVLKQEQDRIEAHLAAGTVDPAAFAACERLHALHAADLGLDVMPPAPRHTFHGQTWERKKEEQMSKTPPTKYKQKSDYTVADFVATDAGHRVLTDEYVNYRDAELRKLGLDQEADAFKGHAGARELESMSVADHLQAIRKGPT